MTDSSRDSSAWLVTPAEYLRGRPRDHEPGCRRSSVHVAMRDGVRLAVDVHLPATSAPGASLPAIVNFTPYYRRFRLSPAAPAGTEASPNTGLYRDFFIPYGYAVVSVDVRGTGASFGAREGFRSPAEIQDCHEVIDWIVAQSWCSGAVGVTGISYVGAASDFAASTGHPAIKAVMPTFAVWDTYGDHFYPGGLLCNCLLAGYSTMIEALDLDRREVLRGYAYFASPELQGPAPVDDDIDGKLLASALAEHAANFDPIDFFHQLACRDAPLRHDPQFTSATISPYHYATGIDRALPHYGVSGWLDGGGYANGTITRYRSLANPDRRFLIGPWDHGARTSVGPSRSSQLPQFELLGETLRFFDHHLKGMATGLEREKPIHYFTMVRETWQSADEWPLPQTCATAYYLGANGTLTPGAPRADSARDEYRTNHLCSSGSHSRYERLCGQPVETYYTDWNGRDALMQAYTGPVLSEDIEVTGHPVVTVFVSSTERDAALFCYLEDVDPDGTCRYVTEGMLRALHRKVTAAPSAYRTLGPYHSCMRADAELLQPEKPAELSLALFPTSWLFRRGHRIRLAIAAADRDHFQRVPFGKSPVLSFWRDRDHPSSLSLPVILR